MNQNDDKLQSIMHEMPDEIQEASEEVKKLWLEWKMMDEENRNHPDRFQYILSPEGETVTIDLMGLPYIIKDKLKKNKVKKKEFDKIMEKQKWFQDRKVVKGNKLRKMKQLLYGSKGQGKNSNKINVLNFKKAKVLDLFGKFYTMREIYDIINKKWGYHLSFNELKRFRTENEALIAQKKAEYILKKDDFRLATETGRLEELSDLYYSLKQKFNTSQRIEYSRELRNIIEQVRKEVKGDEVKLTIDGHIDVNATIQANKNIMDVARRIPIHMLVVGLVAAKQDVDPTQIMAQLASSMYAKLNGFNGIVETEKDNDIIYPSTIIKSYDWGEIKQIAEHNNEKEKLIPLKEYMEYKEKEREDKAFKRKESVKDLLKRFEEVQKQKHKESGRKRGQIILPPK